MAYAANTGKQSTFMEKCVSNGYVICSLPFPCFDCMVCYGALVVNFDLHVFGTDQSLSCPPKIVLMMMSKCSTLPFKF